MSEQSPILRKVLEWAAEQLEHRAEELSWSVIAGISLARSMSYDGAKPESHHVQRAAWCADEMMAYFRGKYRRVDVPEGAPQGTFHTEERPTRPQGIPRPVVPRSPSRPPVTESEEIPRGKDDRRE